MESVTNRSTLQLMLKKNKTNIFLLQNTRLFCKHRYKRRKQERIQTRTEYYLTARGRLYISIEPPCGEFKALHLELQEEFKTISPPDGVGRLEPVWQAVLT